MSHAITLKGIMGAKKKEIKRYTAAELGLGPAEVGESGAREKVLTVGRPPARPAGTIIQDDGEVVDGRISRATLEMLSKARELGRAEAVLLGPAPDDAVGTLSAHGASRVYRSK